VLALRLYQKFYRNNQNMGAGGFHLPKRKEERIKSRKRRCNLQGNTGDLSLENQFGMGQGKSEEL